MTNDADHAVVIAMRQCMKEWQNAPWEQLGKEGFAIGEKMAEMLFQKLPVGLLRGLVSGSKKWKSESL